jgi:hypothetical protein
MLFDCSSTAPVVRSTIGRENLNDLTFELQSRAAWTAGALYSVPLGEVHLESSENDADC